MLVFPLSFLNCVWVCSTAASPFYPVYFTSHKDCDDSDHFTFQQLSLLLTVFRVNLLNLLCQRIYNIINGNNMCKPAMHQMKLNPFKPGWLLLHIVFHYCLCKINVLGDATIPYYFREILYLNVTVGWHQHLDLTGLQTDWV